MPTNVQTESPPDDQGGQPNFLELVARTDPGSVVENHADALRAALASGIDEKTVAWIQGQSCSGCTMSLLQCDEPRIERTLSDLREQISFHTTLMEQAGADAMAALDAPDILIVEGAVPTAVPRAATLGVDEQDRPKPVLDWVLELGEAADIVIAVGSCAAFGGLPAAGRHDSRDVGGSPTGARGLQFDGREPHGVFGPEFRTGADLPVINVAGCPIYPEHLVLTLATILNGHEPDLDEYNRPLPLFGPLVHDECELREEYECGDFASSPGEDGCLYDAGCAGVYAYCDGSMRLRNGGTTVCRQVGAPCIGCVEPAFWDRFSPFYDDGRDDDGSGIATPDAVSTSRHLTPDTQMAVLGRLVGAVLSLLAFPLAVLGAVAWVWDRATSDEPISWSE